MCSVEAIRFAYMESSEQAVNHAKVEASVCTDLSDLAVYNAKEGISASMGSYVQNVNIVEEAHTAIMVKKSIAVHNAMVFQYAVTV